MPNGLYPRVLRAVGHHRRRGTSTVMAERGEQWGATGPRLPAPNNGRGPATGCCPSHPSVSPSLTFWRTPVVHGLLEFDVTAARQRLRHLPDTPTFTAFIVASTAHAVRAHPQVNARRVGHRLVQFDRVDVVVTVEGQETGTAAPWPHVVRAAERQTVQEISAELRQARRPPPGATGGRPRRAVLARLPGPARRMALRAAGRFPASAARLGPAVGVSSLGMFGTGISWGIPVSPMTLMVTVGSIGLRPAIPNTGAPREVLCLTLSFDHTVVDGGPAARFATALRTVIEHATVLPVT